MKTIMGTNSFFKDEADRMNWMGRTGVKGGVKSTADISISIVYTTMEDKMNGVRPKVAFTFRNKSRYAVSKTNHVMIAVVKNRVFFKTSDENNGFLIGSQSNTKEHGYLRISHTDYVSRLLPFIGDYELKYDKFYELYYIEKGETE